MKHMQRPYGSSFQAVSSWNWQTSGGILPLWVSCFGYDLTDKLKKLLLKTNLSTFTPYCTIFHLYTPQVQVTFFPCVYGHRVSPTPYLINMSTSSWNCHGTRGFRASRFLAQMTLSLKNELSHELGSLGIWLSWGIVGLPHSYGPTAEKQKAVWPVLSLQFTGQLQ